MNLSFLCNPRELMYPFEKVDDADGSNMTRCTLIQVMVNLLKKIFSYLKKRIPRYYKHLFILMTKYGAILFDQT